jgi:hypothetical protein
LGPDDNYGGYGNAYWNGWDVAEALVQYAIIKNISSDLGNQCLSAVIRYIAEVHRRMLTHPTSSWSQNRWQDWVYLIDWVFDLDPQGQEQMLLDAAEQARAQSWDWDGYYKRTGVGTSGAYLGQVLVACQ